MKRARGTRRRPRSRQRAGRPPRLIEARPRAFCRIRGPRTSARDARAPQRREENATATWYERTPARLNRCRTRPAAAVATPSRTRRRRRAIERVCRAPALMFGENPAVYSGVTSDAQGGGGAFAADTRRNPRAVVGISGRRGDAGTAPWRRRSRRAPRGAVSKLRGSNAQAAGAQRGRYERADVAALGSVSSKTRLGRPPRGGDKRRRLGARRGHCEAQEHVAEGARCLGKANAFVDRRFGEGTPASTRSGPPARLGQCVGCSARLLRSSSLDDDGATLDGRRRSSAI